MVNYHTASPSGASTTATLIGVGVRSGVTGPVNLSRSLKAKNKELADCSFGELWKAKMVEWTMLSAKTHKSICKLLYSIIWNIVAHLA